MNGVQDVKDVRGAQPAPLEQIWVKLCVAFGWLLAFKEDY